MPLDVQKASLLVIIASVFASVSLADVHLVRDTEYITIQHISMPYDVPASHGYGQPLIKNVPYEDIERILTIAQTIQCALLNIPCTQSILIAMPETPTIQALWYTNPAIILYDGSLGDAAWVSLFHEIAHVLTLNFPAQYRLGGHIDGNANAIVSETLAQILSVVTAQEIRNYGIPLDIQRQISQSLDMAYGYLVLYHDRYVESNRFVTWNDPSTPFDETMPTFMGISYEFLSACDTSCVYAVQQVFTRVRTFNADVHSRYNQHVNSQEADVFRMELILFWLFG